jgi:hypothetical protein
MREPEINVGFFIYMTLKACLPAGREEETWQRRLKNG